MRSLIERYRALSERVTYMGHLVPMDHEETAAHHQVLWFFITWFICMAPILYLFRNVPKEHEAAMILPTLITIGVAWSISHLLYLRRMDKLITKFVPGSFTIPVAPATF